MAEYVKFDDLKWRYDIVIFEYKSDLSNDMLPYWKKYETYKLTDYKTLTSSQIQEMNDLGEQLRNWGVMIEAADYNKCFDLMANVQSFIKNELPDYINDCLTEAWNQVNLGIKDVNDLKDDISTWWSSIKNNITIHGWFEFDNYIMLENVDYYQTDFENNKIVETISYNNIIFATRTTTFSENIINERIIVFEVDGITKVHDKTLITTFNANGTINSTVISNI